MLKLVFVTVTAFLLASLAVGENEPPLNKSPEAAHYVVCRVESPALNGLPVSDRAAITTRLVGRALGPSGMQEMTERMRDAFQTRGFFNATVSEPTIQPLAASTPQGHCALLTFYVNTGKQYRLKEDFHWGGNKTFAASDLQQLASLHAGDVFDTEKMREIMAGVAGLYSSIGYTQARVFPKPQFDDASQSVLVIMEVVEGPIQAIAVGKPVPPLRLKTLEGKEANLDDFLGKAVLIDFWATWCGACIVQMPLLNQLSTELKDNGIILLGITQDADPVTARKYLEKRGYQWTNLHDPGGSVAKSWGFQGVPALVLVGKDGKVLFYSVGSEADSEAKIRSALHRLDARIPE